MEATCFDEQSTDAKVMLGIDEFTLVLQPVKKVNVNIWAGLAEDMIDEFVNLSKIKLLFGELEQTEQNLVQGYNTGYILEGRPFYLCICFHAVQEGMGVCCKLSATAYAMYKEEYLRKYKEEMNLPKFLRMVKSDNYTQRLSRVDFTADYFNIQDPIYQNQYLHPDTIYNCLLKNQMKVVDCKGRTNIKTWSGLNKNGSFETVYIGSRKGKTNGYLRIYNKKQEQIDNHGYRCREAEECDSWIRFEAVYKGIYSHQISETLMNDALIQTDNDLKCFIAGKIIDKYIFKYTSNEDIVDFSEMLISIASGKEYASLECVSPRDNSLYQSLKYIIKNSGLLITLAKAHYLYVNQNVEKKILDWILYMFQEYYLEKIEVNNNHEVYKWLKKHTAEMQKQKIEDILDYVEADITSEDAWMKIVQSMNHPI